MSLLCCRCHKEILSGDGWYGLHNQCFRKSFNEEPLEFLDVAIRNLSQAPTERPSFNSSFFHGKFRKYSARLGGTSYILKVEQPEYPELPATEFICNLIYESLGVEVPPYHLIRFPEDSLCFATRNFMSDIETATLDHLYHFMHPKERYDCETLVNIIGEKTGRRIEQEKFAYLTLVDSLLGNNDRHGRNLGLIKTLKGVSLAPFYDNPSALAVENYSFLSADLQPRGAIFTKYSDEPTMKDYIAEWNRLGYQNMVNRFRKSVASGAFKQYLELQFLSEKRRNALKRLIEKRSEEIYG
jgi:hypothetical protein